MVNLKWSPPKQPNGVIGFYFIAYKSLRDKENFVNQSDNCAFGNWPFPVEWHFTSLIFHFEYLSQGSISKYSDHFFTTTTTAAPADSGKNSQPESNTNCVTNSFDNYQDKKRKKFDDQEKIDIILVEDEIYNLAFRPLKL